MDEIELDPETIYSIHEMPFKILATYPEDSWVASMRRRLAEENEGKVFPDEYVPVLDMKAGFVSNIINYCVKAGFIKNVFVLPLPFFEKSKENQQNLAILYQLVSQGNGRNFLVNVNDKICVLCNVRLENDNYLIDELRTFHYI